MDPLPPRPILAQAPTKEERTWAMAVHLSAFAGHLFPLAHVIVPLVIWLIKKDESAFVNDQGKEAVNAQITLTIYGVVAFVLCFVLIGFLALAALWVVGIVLVIVAAMAAYEGETYRYPGVIRFVK